MLDLQHAGALDVRRGAEPEQELRVDAVGLQLDQRRVAPRALLAARVDQDHRRLDAQRADLGREEVLLHDFAGGQLPALARGGDRERHRGDDDGDEEAGHRPPPLGAAPANIASRLAPKTKRGLNSIISARRKNSAKNALIAIVAVTMFDRVL